MIGTRSSRSRDHVAAGLEQVVVTVARPNLLVLLWRWRYEIGALLALAVTGYALVRVVGATGTLGLCAALIVTVGIALSLSPVLRRLATARAWCVITQHRLRTGCAQARIHSRQGKGRLPFVLWTSAEPYGERVRLWSRAGISVDDFHAARQVLTAACWATDVRVTVSPRYAHLVIVEVVRGEGSGLSFGHRPRPGQSRPAPVVPEPRSAVPTTPPSAVPSAPPSAPPAPPAPTPIPAQRQPTD